MISVMIIAGIKELLQQILLLSMLIIGKVILLSCKLEQLQFSVKLESLEIDTEANKPEVAGEVTVTEKSVLDEILAAASGGSALRLDGERNGLQSS
nr:DExH-box ATP-dependent RNA helicase DExH11 isoform X2 [Ipomoea batatas]